MHSQRLSEKPLRPWAIVDTSGTIRSAHCDCMAGLGETCTHVAAMLFAIEYNIRQREKKTVTQEKAYWLVPSVREAPYAEASDIDFTSAKSKKKKMDSGTSSSPFQESRKPTRSIPEPTNDELKDFYTAINKSASKPAILCFIEPYAQEYVPKTSTADFPPALDDLYNKDLHGKNFPEVIDHCKSIKLTVTAEQSKNVEEETRQQAKSNTWFRYRSGRITASRMKSACHTDPRQPSQSLIKTVCYPSLFKFSTEATKWGCDHEQVALDEYQMLYQQQHTDCDFSEAGLTIDVDNPHIGASPDGFVSCSCCGHGCVEIKCPFCKKEITVEEAATDNKFCLEEGDDGELHLKKAHQYYYQVQTQLHVTKRDFCDFVVWTEKSLHYERILPDPDFWQDILKRASQFFLFGILPELTAKFYTSPSPATNLTSRQSTYCYCQSTELDASMMECAAGDCLKKLFHKKCIWSEDLILTVYNSKRKTWTCPDCSKRPNKKARTNHET